MTEDATTYRMTAPDGTMFKMDAPDGHDSAKAMDMLRQRVHDYVGTSKQPKKLGGTLAPLNPFATPGVGVHSAPSNPFSTAPQGISSGLAGTQSAPVQLGPKPATASNDLLARTIAHPENYAGRPIPSRQQDESNQELAARNLTVPAFGQDYRPTSAGIAEFANAQLTPIEHMLGVDHTPAERLIGAGETALMFIPGEVGAILKSVGKWATKPVVNGITKFLESSRGLEGFESAVGKLGLQPNEAAAAKQALEARLAQKAAPQAPVAPAVPPETPGSPPQGISEPTTDQSYRVAPDRGKQTTLRQRGDAVERLLGTFEGRQGISASGLSDSQYHTLTTDKGLSIKVRVADHDLPSMYDANNEGHHVYDMRNGSAIADLKQELTDRGFVPKTHDSTPSQVGKIIAQIKAQGGTHVLGPDGEPWYSLESAKHMDPPVSLARLKTTLRIMNGEITPEQAAIEMGVTPDIPPVQPGSPQADIPSATPTTQPLGNPEGLPQDATGLANQVQNREAIAGVIDKVESTKGKSPEAWQEIGQAAVKGGTDPELLAHQIGKGDIELTGERVGILLEGKRTLMNDVNRARLAAESNPELAGTYEAAARRLQDYLDNVQAGKGAWSDVGRALQAGTTLNEGDFASVLIEAKRTRDVSPKVEKQLAELTGQVAEKDAKIADLEAKLNSPDAAAHEATAKARTNRKFDRASVTKELDDLFAEFKNLRGAGGVGKGKTRGAAATITADDLKVAVDQARIVGKIALGYAKLGAATLEDVVIAVQSEFLKRFNTQIDRQAVIDALGMKGETKSQSDAQLQLTKLRAHARTESTQGKAEVQSQIDELKSQLGTGDLKQPAGKAHPALSLELENLRAERHILAGQVRARLAQHAEGVGHRVVKGAAGVIRGTLLGADVGVVTRQGRFALESKAIIPSLRNAVKSLFSETEFAKVALRQAEKKTEDGRLLAPIRKKAGLSISNTFTDGEELSATRLLKLLPIVGKHIGGSLERFQSAFINTARIEGFDSAVRAGFTPEELQLRAKFINNVTGRSNLKQVPEMLQLIMTSPRYEASRWGVLGEPIRNLGALARNPGNKAARANLLDLGKTAASTYALFKLAETAGYTVSYDKDSPDFLKLRRGDDVWDVSVGLAPRIRDVLSLLGTTTDPSYKDNLVGHLGKTVGRTLSPGVTVPYQQLSYAIQGKDATERIDPLRGMRDSTPQEGMWQFAPLVAQSAKQAMKEEGPISALWAAGREFIGGNVSRYPEK